LVVAVAWVQKGRVPLRMTPSKMDAARQIAPWRCRSIRWKVVPT